ncbi:MAG: nucleotidyltransferase domain-containing protein [Actinobacteria bacterium]|nr:nucleotidyltransferase domain-containing protein [Actinomycetota bacterium]
MINKSKLQEFKRLKYKIDLQNRQNLEILTKQAWEKAKAAAKLIKKDFGASKVILYGSLASGYFKEGSDIDLLVKEFKRSFWDMYIKVEEIVSPIPVSVVCEEDASKSLILEAYKKGVEL